MMTRGKEIVMHHASKVTSTTNDTFPVNGRGGIALEIVGELPPAEPPPPPKPPPRKSFQAFIVLLLNPMHNIKDDAQCDHHTSSAPLTRCPSIGPPSGPTVGPPNGHSPFAGPYCSLSCNAAFANHGHSMGRETNIVEVSPDVATAVGRTTANAEQRYAAMSTKLCTSYQDIEGNTDHLE